MKGDSPVVMSSSKDKRRYIRVLMIGPGEGVPGGISSLVQAFVPLLRHYVDLEYLPTVMRRPLKESGKVSLRNIALALWQYVRFAYLMWRFRPQIIHVHTSQGIAWFKDTFFIMVGRVCRCRMVLHMHGGNFDVLYNRSAPLVQRYTRKVCGLADAIIAVSGEWKERLSHIISAERVLTLRNCIAVDIISQGDGTQGDSMLFLGSLGPSKGVFDLIEAMGCLRARGLNPHIWLAGYEEREGDLDRVRARLEELGLEHVCELVGMVQGTRKAQLLRDASLFVLPSYREGLPMAVLEAMAAGLPVVATRVGGIPDVINDGYNGYLVAPGDVKALADRLAFLAENSDLRAIMGRRCREIAERELDVKPYVTRLVALYETLLDGQRP